MTIFPIAVAVLLCAAPLAEAQQAEKVYRIGLLGLSSRSDVTGLAAYRRHLAAVTTEEFEPQLHKTRWGHIMSVENLLEHAVVHPMRHRIQIERILEGSKAMSG